MVRHSTARKPLHRKPRHRMGTLGKIGAALAAPFPDVEMAVASMANPDSGIKFVLGIAKKAGKRASAVQSVIFDKLKWTADTAKGWLHEHGFTGTGKDEGATFWRFRQQSPRKYKEFRTIVPGTRRNPGTELPETPKHATGTDMVQFHPFHHKWTAQSQYGYPLSWHDSYEQALAAAQAYYAKHPHLLAQENPQKWLLPFRRGKKNYEDVGYLPLALEHDIGFAGDKTYNVVKVIRSASGMAFRKMLTGGPGVIYKRDEAMAEIKRLAAIPGNMTEERWNPGPWPKVYKTRKAAEEAWYDSAPGRNDRATYRKVRGGYQIVPAGHFGDRGHYGTTVDDMERGDTGFEENPDVAESISSYDEHLGITTRPEFQEATPDEQAAAMTAMDLCENPADPAQVMQAHGWRPGDGVGAGWVHADFPGHSFHTSSSGAWDHRQDGSNVGFGNTVQELETHLSVLQGREENPSIPTPVEIQPPFSPSRVRDFGLTLVHQLGGEPRNYLHEVGVHGQDPDAVRYLQDAGYHKSHGWLDRSRHQWWVYRKEYPLSVAEWAGQVGPVENPRPIVVGDKVKYKSEFLRSIGAYTGPMGHARGIVTDIEDHGGSFVLAVIDWRDGGELPNKVNVKNLIQAGVPNPENPPRRFPLPQDDSPASVRKVMDIVRSTTSLRTLHDAWEWAGQWNEGGDVWLPGDRAAGKPGIISVIAAKLGRHGKSFDDLLRFEKQGRNPAPAGYLDLGQDPVYMSPEDVQRRLSHRGGRAWGRGRYMVRAYMPGSNWHADEGFAKTLPAAHAEGRRQLTAHTGADHYMVQDQVNAVVVNFDAQGNEVGRGTYVKDDPDPRVSESITVENPSDLGQDAFDAGKAFRLSGAYYETGVANARVAKYGFSKWYNNLPLWGRGPRPARTHTKARLLKNWMEGWAAGKRVEKAQANPNFTDKSVGSSREPLYWEAPQGGYKGEAYRDVTGTWWFHMGGKLRWKIAGKVIARQLENALSLGHLQPRGRENPESSAAQLYEDFHGRPPGKVKEIVTEVRDHEWLVQLGTLVELKVATVTKLDATISFAKDKDAPDLCSSEDGRQLYIEGGDQGIDLKALKMSGDKWVKESMVIGVLYELTYQTEKGFHKFKLTDYYHKLGEETGVQPTLLYDPVNNLLSVSGGQYEIKPEGIIN